MYPGSTASIRQRITIAYLLMREGIVFWKTF